MPKYGHANSVLFPLSTAFAPLVFYAALWIIQHFSFIKKKTNHKQNLSNTEIPASPVMKYN